MITPTSTKSKNYQALGIDEIANDIETVFDKANDLQDQIDNLPQGGGGTTVEVNISSAQILAMGTSPIELLPAPGVGKYYDIEKIILEYTHVTTPYTLATYLYVYEQTELGLITQFLDQQENVRFILKPNGTTPPVDAVENYSFGYAQGLDKSVLLGTYSGADPTDGDGTLRAIITYTTRTFGA